MKELLAQYGAGIEGRDLSFQFNKLWDQWSENQKDRYLMPYLTATPSPGYAALATLIRKGYIDTIITFNFDRLLQQALVAAGLHEDEDFKVVVRGDHADDKLIALMGMSEPRIKILKVHGSLTGATFLWSDVQMLTYPPTIHQLVATLTARPIVICGYGFQDVCAERAFSPTGEAIYCVNKDGIPSKLRGFMANRRSESLVLEGADGMFDSFFGELLQAMEASPSADNASPRKNPFKYLESHDVEDAECFLGRESEAQELTRKVQQQTRPVICLIGPPKSGKTSLVRAGMIARLDEERDLAVYVRCRGTLEQSLRTRVQKLLPHEKQEESGRSILQTLAATTTQHVVVILDQFERLLPQQTRSVGREALRFLRQLAEASAPNLTVVCVSTSLEDLILELLQNAPQISPQIDWMILSKMEPARVSEVIRGLAALAGFEVAPEIVEKLQEEYARGLETEQGFSLGLIQAICHVLCEEGPGDVELYRRMIRDERAGLELAINRYDIVNFIADVPNVEERCLLRDIIRLVSHAECNQKIVNYVREHVNGKLVPHR